VNGFLRGHVHLSGRQTAFTWMICTTQTLYKLDFPGPRLRCSIIPRLHTSSATMATNTVEDWPYPTRTFSRQDAIRDLRAYAARMHKQYHVFGTQTQPTSSRTSSHPHSPAHESTKPVSLRRTTTGESTQPPSPAAKHETQDAPDFFGEVSKKKQAEYSRRVAESTRTRHGRGWKGKATTQVCFRHVFCHASAYTRPAAIILDEVVRVRHPVQPN
jgi:hypothetical protein